MPARILIDAGPIVAFLRASDQWHPWAVKQFKHFSTLATCDAVLAEACARLAYYGNDQSRVMDLVVNGSLTTEFAVNPAAARIAGLMKKYASRPMDFADACLVVMSEQVHECLLVTLDATDFSVYRRHERQVIPFLSPKS